MVGLTCSSAYRGFLSCQSNQPSQNIPQGGKAGEEKQQTIRALHSSAGIGWWKQSPFLSASEHTNQTWFLFRTGLLLRCLQPAGSQRTGHPKNAPMPAFVSTAFSELIQGTSCPTLTYLMVRPWHGGLTNNFWLYYLFCCFSFLMIIKNENWTGDS